MNNFPQPFQVGLTGGIGTGKSTVSQIFSALSIPVYEADARSKWLLDHNEKLKLDLISAFGNQAYMNGKYNRAYLANIVFYDKSKNKVINDIVHPWVLDDYENWLKENINSSYVLKESALLFESGGDKLSDKIIVVTAPKDLRIKRILKRDVFRSVDEINAIMDKQMPEEEKIKGADYIIVNNETEFLVPQVLKIHHECIKVALLN